MGNKLVLQSVLELVGLVVLLVVVGGAILCGIDERLAPPRPKRRRKRQTCPARIVNGRKS